MFSRSKRLLGMLGNPQDTHKAIHVAGTSGKGTVCYMIDAILRAHNKRTALIVSPHVYDIRERIQINHQYAPEKQYIKAANLVISCAREMAQAGNAPSYYEVMAAISFLLTSQKTLDYTIVETGLGGRYDLSNAVSTENKYCVITQIGLDHTQILGTTYEQIAAQKAEILYPKAKVTVLRQKDSVNQVIDHISKSYDAQLSWVEPFGNYEVDDLLLALDATKNVAARDGWLFNEELARDAAEMVYIPGRFEKRTLSDHLVILDGAHNPQKLRALASRLERESYSPATIIFALGEHNDYEGSLRAIKKVCERLIVCEFFSGSSIRRRAISPAQISSAAQRLGFTNIVKQPIPSLAMQEALAHQEPIVITGSFYLLGEIDRLF